MPAAPISSLNDALVGRQCHVERREADWNFNFGDGVNIVASVPWRIVTSNGIAHGDEDDGQSFGLPQPVDGQRRTNELIADRAVLRVDLDGLTSDLRISFEGGTRLDLFNNSSAYEGWQAYLGGASQAPNFIGLGGGKLGP